MTKLRLLQGTERTSRAAKVAKFSGNKLGVICLTNCDCKNECSSMFGPIDTNTESACRRWCDKVKAKKNDLKPSTDPNWSARYLSMTTTPTTPTNDTPPPTGDTTGKGGIDDIISGLFGSIFGTTPTTTTPAATTQQPKILGIPQGTALLIGGVIIIFLATRKRKKGGRR